MPSPKSLKEIINSPELQKWALEQIDLAKATRTAVRKRRAELEADLFHLMTWPDARKENDTYIPEQKTTGQLTTKDYEDIAAIKKELQIIENLMIRTNQEYEKLGHKVNVYIKAGKEVKKIGM